MYRKIYKTIKNLLKTNLVKTIYLNFRMLPFKQAVKLPIFIYGKIVFGGNSRISWDCQIMDTAFHYVENLLDGDIKPLTSPIVLGNNIWIGNRTTIAKGTVLPDYTIVASNSLVNKDFSSIGENCLIAGLPAKLKQQNIRRVFDSKVQKKLDKKFNYIRTHL